MKAYKGTMEMAKYNLLNDKEKNNYYLRNIGVPLNKIDDNTKLTNTYLSFCVHLYINSTKKEQDLLWNLYKHPLVQYYCDPDKYDEENNINR